MRLRLLALAFAAVMLGTAIGSDVQACNGGRSAGQGSGASAKGQGWNGKGNGNGNGNGWHGGHKHWRGNAFIGVGLYDPWYWWYGYSLYPYYYPFAAPITFEQQYIEQYAVPLQAGFWYYCHSAGAYYPGVAECPEGWEQVVPR